MNFSDLISYSGQAHYSPNSQFIAILKGNVLSIFTTSHLNTYMTFNLPDTVNILEWSPDSKCILAGISKRGQIKLFSVENPQWQGTISMNPSGLSGAFWAPNSTSILTSTDFCLRMTIWSLIDMTAVHIKGPKYPDKGYAFSSEGKFLALAERSESTDYIGIYFVADWTLVNHFKVETFDLCDLLWTHDDTAIIVWDTSLVYQLLIYSPTGTLMARHQPYTNGLGIKSVSLSPDGDFLGVGSYDSEMRVFCNLSWRFLTNFPHKTSITEGADIHIYKEEEYKEGIGAGGLDERTTSRCKIYSDGLLDLPIKLNANKIPTDKPNPPMGVSICAWSTDNRYVATKNDNTPNVLWIWDVQTLSLHIILIQLQPIKWAAWSPVSLHLAFCTGTSRLYMWSLEGASVCDVPLESKDFHVNKIKWSADGQSMLLLDKNNLQVAYPKFELLGDDYDYT